MVAHRTDFRACAGHLIPCIQTVVFTNGIFVSHWIVRWLGNAGNMDTAQSAQSVQSHSQSVPQMSSQMVMEMPQNVNSVAAMGVAGQIAAVTPATASPSPQPGAHSARGGQGSMSGGNNQFANLQVNPNSIVKLVSFKDV